jgi:hypothetical protein
MTITSSEPHFFAPWPHEGGCAGCREEKLCNACGAPWDHAGAHCTNGRCAQCHIAYCTVGGQTYPGHGYGNLNSVRGFNDG